MMSEWKGYCAVHEVGNRCRFKEVGTINRGWGIMERRTRL